jgi:hypothetical protein
VPGATGIVKEKRVQREDDTHVLEMKMDLVVQSAMWVLFPLFDLLLWACLFAVASFRLRAWPQVALPLIAASVTGGISSIALPFARGVVFTSWATFGNGSVDSLIWVQNGLALGGQLSWGISFSLVLFGVYRALRALPPEGPASMAP